MTPLEGSKQVKYQDCFDDCHDKPNRDDGDGN